MFVRKLIIYLTVVESAATEWWSTEVPVVAESQTWSGNLGGTLESTGVMLNEFWFPFIPEVIELLDDLVDLVVNTKVVVGLQSLDFIGLVGFFTESTEEELVELALVLSSKL